MSDSDKERRIILAPAELTLAGILLGLLFLVSYHLGGIRKALEGDCQVQQVTTKEPSH